MPSPLPTPATRSAADAATRPGGDGDRPGHRRATGLPALLVFGLGLLLSVAAARWQAGENQRQAEAALQAIGERTAAQIADRLQRYADGLGGTRAVIVAADADSVTRTAFRAAYETRDNAHDFPGARGFGFVRRVPTAAEAGFVAAARRDGAPDFTVRAITPHDGERYVIQFIEPLEVNFRSIGLDIGSEPTRRATAERAARTGAVAITPPITLSAGVGQPGQSFLILLPVYRPGRPLASAADRMAATLGWAFAPLRMEDVLRGLSLPDVPYEIAIFDRPEPTAKGVPIYGRAAVLAADAGGPVQQVEQPVFGRQWLVEVRARPGFVDTLNLLSPAAVAVAGVLVSALSAALLAVFLAGRRNQRQVQRQQQRLAALVEYSSDAMVTESPEGRITAWNGAAERLLGYSADEALGRDGAQLLLPPERQAQAAALRDRLRRGQVPEPCDQVLLRKDGQRLETSIAVSPIYGTAGELVGVGHTLRDISERSAAERRQRAFTVALEQQVAERTAALGALQRDLQAVLDAVPSLIGYWDRDLRNRFANHAYQEWFGVEPGTMTGRHLRDLLGDALFERNRPFIQAALHGEPQTFERAIPSPDGDGWRHSLAHYLPDVVDGIVQGFYEMVHDVSALKESQRRLDDALRENEALLSTIKAHALYSVTDRQGRIVDVNEGFCRISGYARAELIGQNHRLIGSDFHDSAFWVDLWGTIAAGQAWRGEICNRAQDGRLYWVDSIIAPFMGSDGEPQRYIAIRHDITASKQAEQVMRIAMQAAESASAAKSSFLANMSHEIRTPLNAMIGLTYLLDHGRLDAEQRSFVAKIQLASRSLLGVVNDVLDLAKIEAGEARVEAAPFDLHELLDGMAALYGHQAQAKGLSFRMSRPEGLPQHVLGDATRLRQVLSNLLANAIKFTEHGSVALVLRLLARDETGLTLGLEVQDTGIGIAPEVQDSIFQPFAQADSSTTRRFGGTGLGLSIVRELIALLGGEITLDSTPGEGSIFCVTLRLGAVTAAADDGATTGAGLSELRLLIVDDDPLQTSTLVGQAQALGWRAEAVGDGLAAVQALGRPSEQGGLPDVLLVDWHLRDGTGLQALAAMAAAVGSDRLPPAVLVSSADTATLRALPQDPKVDSRLSLPVEASALFNAVNGAVTRRTGDPERALRATRLEGAGALWLPGVCVLVVDDSDINREVAARILGREGAIVTSCGSAADALQKLRETPLAFDLVLMDVQMPDMDGNAATRRIRGELGLASLPVLALTAGALLAERQRVLDAGMNDFISKPLDPDHLIRSVRRHVERSRGKPLPVRLREAPLPEAGQVPWPVIDGIDGADAALRLANDLPLFRSLLERLLREFQDLMTEPLAAPQEETECAALAARAHRLRGSAGMLGAHGVQQQASALEARLRQPTAAAGAAPLCDLMTALARSLRSLQQASAPALAKPQPATDAPAAEPLTLAARKDLLARLRAQDLSALKRFEALAAGLRAALGNARFDEARDALGNLRFAQAVALLDEQETA